MADPGLVQAALDLHHAGLSSIPAADDGTKAPWPGGPRWETYMHRRATETELRAWYTGRPTLGVGVVCGTISGGLVGLDIEARAVTEGTWAQFIELATNSGLGQVLAAVAAGYTETTGSGGVHLLWRVNDGQGVPSTKLAQRPASTAELAAEPQAKRKVLIETKSEGGFLITAPTAGTVHPDGGTWRLLAGGPATITTITREQCGALLDLARMLDQIPRPEPAPLASALIKEASDPSGGIRPGDDYENKTTWDELLNLHGWTHVHTHGHTRYWRRPGKTIGVSATTGHATDRDRLFVFSTSSEFDAERPYTKFGAYTVLEHHGDHGAAARALRSAGYGTPQPLTPGLRLVTGDGHAAGTSGATALAPRPTPVGHLDPLRYGPTEDGLALALVDTHRQNIRYCPQRGQWLTWETHRWSWDSPELVREHVRELARTLPDGDGWATFKKRALSASGVTGILRLAQSDPCLVVHIDSLDARPYELNTPAGIVDMNTGGIRPPEPGALHTRCTTVAPDFDRPGDAFARFLADTFAGDGDLAGYMQRLLGLSALGAVLEQILIFAQGEGANGKSTLIEAAMHALGRGQDGYSIAAPSEMLMARKHSEHPAEIAQLAGARLVVCSELEDGARFAESRIKQLTGRDSINARFMRQDPFTFTPSHTFVLVGNHRPNTSAGGPAFWRRMKMVPFSHVVPEKERDPGLGEKLESEAPAILAWMIHGAAEYRTGGGLRVPAAARAATADYAHDQDTVGRFVEENCHQAPGQTALKVAVPALRSAYETWCRSEGQDPISANRLSTELQSRFGVARERNMSTRFYLGIALVDTDPVTEDGWKR